MNVSKQLTGFLTITKYTIKKLLFSKRLLIVFLIMALMCGVAYYSVIEDAKKVDFVNIIDLLVLFFFMPIIAMIYGSTLIRDEIDDRSITQIVTTPMNKMVTYLGYYLGLTISVTIIMLMVFSSAFLVFFGGIGFEGSASIFGDMAVLLIIGSIVYSSLFLMISVLIPKPIFLSSFRIPSPLYLRYERWLRPVRLLLNITSSV